jgi:hypothetical protein
MGEGGIEVIRRLSVCIHIQPLKKIQSSRGFHQGQESNPIEINVDYL